MEYQRKLRRIGNSLGITIPSELLQKLNMQDGDTIHVNEIDGKIILSSESQKDIDKEFKEKVIKVIEEYMERTKKESDE